jgi:hypothetical protein
VTVFWTDNWLLHFVLIAFSDNLFLTNLPYRKKESMQDYHTVCDLPLPFYTGHFGVQFSLASISLCLQQPLTWIKCSWIYLGILSPYVYTQMSVHSAITRFNKLWCQIIFAQVMFNPIHLWEPWTNKFSLKPSETFTLHQQIKICSTYNIQNKEYKHKDKDVHFSYIFISNL